ncbi:helix-turn-helix protein [Tissierella praeacuta]|uniref:helix-turn-helix domain-containing protein n=1 Tax=Tissierella praeacuta TaxID=43131 RepID=UPI00104DB65D|nr:helix-turn-helix transcriptional regulator [Tissierella praeacuta]TCU77241.1 helix-turn-helix protein [Tissierella praeacuta]
MDLSNIGKRIQNRREELGMKQEELAERVSLSPNYMSAIERGVKIPRLETFIRIANALEVSTDILLEDVLVKGNEIKASNLWEEINHLPSKEQERILRVIKVMVEMETND